MNIDQNNSLLGLFTFCDLERVMADNRQLGNRPPSTTAYHGMSRHDLRAELRDFFHSADFHADVNKAIKSSIDDLYSNVQRIEKKVNTLIISLILGPSIGLTNLLNNKMNLPL